MNLKNTLTTAGVALAAITALACGAGDPTPSNKPIATGAPATGTSTATKAADKPAPLKYAMPKPAEIKLTVKVLEKQCFGSAGCNLQFRISKVTYTGSGLDPEATYEVSYSYKGLESPQQGTFALSGDGQAELETLEFGSTGSSSKKVTAVVTDVEKM